jgi:hypothetical protein
MKQFILIHAASSTDSKQIDAILIPTAHIEGTCPSRDAEGLTAVNLTDGSSYRVVETAQEIRDLIYPSPFVEIEAVNRENPEEHNPILVRKELIQSVVLTNKSGVENLYAVELEEGMYVTKNSLFSLKGLLNDD